MSLEDDLKAKTLALISQQMATWVVEIQRNIARNQENLVRTLDDLQEMVARYDEKINEAEIEKSILQVLKNAPAAAPAGPGFDKLKASLAEVEKGASLSEVLMYLVNEVSQYVDRACMFIVKGSSAIGWYARGLEPPDLIKQVSISLNSDTVFRIVHNTRHAERGHIDHSPGTAQALARMGGSPQGILSVPLILRDKLAAILYCDTSHDEVPKPIADLVEVLVMYSSRLIDMLSAVPRPAAGARTTGGSSADRAAQIRAGGEDVRERAGIPRSAPAPVPAPPAPAPPPPPAPVSAQPDEGSSTVMFTAGAMQQMRQQMPAPPAVAPPPPPPPRPAPPPSMGVSPEEQKAHEDAKRFARLVVSEIKLYNEAKVNEGRRHKDIYERLKEDIERGRQMYGERVASQVRESTNYFYDELVRILAGGDASALGPM
jgi:hypothetical protein